MRKKGCFSHNPVVSTILIAGPLPEELASPNKIKTILTPAFGVLSILILEEQRREALLKYALITVKNFLVAADLIKRLNGRKYYGTTLNVYIKPPKKLPRTPKKEYRASKYTLYKPNPKFKLRRMPGSHGRQ